MKKDHKESGSRRKFRDPREARQPKPNLGDQNTVAPKVVTHKAWKSKEKTRNEDQWGPLGW